jgi:prepilin-type N-terminal cleavage/methylation domain-containing protein/prepilin-type processing-associated H-X9-DG protein
MNRMVRKDIRAAFTLIELLVVVAMIAVLMAILLPALRGARVLASRNRCAANLKNIATAWDLYLDDHQGKFSFRGYGANPQWEFGGWSGPAPYGYARHRPLNPYLGLDPCSATEAEAKVFCCPADAGDTNNPSVFYRERGNSYRANTALGCGRALPEYDESWGTIHREVNLRLPGLLRVNVPGDTLLVGDYNWLTQIDPIWKTCAKDWHGQRHRYNVAFLDTHVEHVHIHKGVYFEQDTYRWQPFRALDPEVGKRQQPVPCSCGRE